MNIRDILFLLLCLITYRHCDVHGQSFESKEVNTYVNKISKLVHSSFASYGLANLPDVNTKVRYNVSNILGYHLVGDLFFENGFVSDFKLINSSTNDQMIIWNDAICIYAEMQFLGLTVSRDFRFVPLEPIGMNDTTMGNVLIHPFSYRFDVLLAKNITTNKLIADVQTYGFLPGWEMLTFIPDNGLTQRLRKMYRHQFMAGNQTDAFDGLFPLWKPIFEKFLREAVQKVKFPTLKFQVGRKHILAV